MCACVFVSPCKRIAMNTCGCVYACVYKKWKPTTTNCYAVSVDNSTVWFDRIVWFVYFHLYRISGLVRTHWETANIITIYTQSVRPAAIDREWRENRSSCYSTQKKKKNFDWNGIIFVVFALFCSILWLWILFFVSFCRCLCACVRAR